MSIWSRNADANTYSATFPVAGGRHYEITVSEDDFADDEFAKGKGEYLPLKEGRFYHYEISGGGKLAAVSSFAKGGGKVGRLAPGTSVGYGRLWLEGHTKPEEALDVEVVSDIIGYKDDYEKLLSQLTGYVADLQMQCSSDVAYDVGADEEAQSKTKLQEYLFLVGLVNDTSFALAVRRIIENPYTRLITVEEERDIRRATRFSSAMMRELASNPRRIKAPPSLCGLGLLSIPERINGVRRETSVDVPENRFVKHVLTVFRARLQEFGDKIAEGKLRANATKLYAIELDVKASKEKLDGWLGSEFFRSIGPLTAMPSSSVVLQRREGYRDVLRTWLRSQAASKMQWEAGEKLYRENQKDVATLYEYWCFFRLLDIIKDMFDITGDEMTKKLIDTGSDGLSLKINEGCQLDPLEGHYASPHTSQRYRQLDIEYQYNRRFTKASGGSWSMMMIPDYTISFRPHGMDVTTAENLDLITYVHFDAKYKAKDILVNLAAGAGEGGEEKAPETEEVKYEKDVKRVDILKMHTYRDAIPRTAGAYILFPGDANRGRNYKSGDEILPGLGAFPLYPKDDNSDDEPIRKFLGQIAEYLCDRITRWENFTYQKNLIYSGTQAEWGRHQAEIANRFKYLKTIDDTEGTARTNLSDKDRLASIPPNLFYSFVPGNKKEKGQGRDHQVRWIRDHHLFVKSTGQNDLSCEPEDLLMVIGMWYPPFTMMVKRYCGTKTRAELEADGLPLPFPGRDTFHVWEVSLHNFDHVEKYLNEHQ